MFEECHIHERLNNVLNVLNRMTLTGFQQFDSVATAMKELAALDQEILRAEQEAGKDAKDQAD